MSRIELHTRIKAMTREANFSSFACALLILLIQLFSITGKAQNLVPNPGFEEGLTCPTSIGNVGDECLDWYPSVGPLDPISQPTPDWFHACSSYENLSPPDILNGNQLPFEGSGYVGMFTYVPGFAPIGYSENIAVQLNSALEVGHQYLVEFKVHNLIGALGLATNNMGFRFTTFPAFPSSEEGIDNFSHFRVDTVISDTANWVAISDVFQADSAYEYFHIGNFYKDENTVIDTILPMASGAAYYLIDDVSITEWKTTDAHTEVNKRIKIWPNPCSGRVLHIEGLNERIEQVDLISLSGARIVTLPKFGQGEPTINIPEVTTGVYLIKIQTESHIYFEKVMITD